MVDPVVLLLSGRGFRTIRAKEAGLATEDDALLIDYALANDLILVTFDAGNRSAARRHGCRCLHVKTPELTARDRLGRHFDAVIALFVRGVPLVTLPVNGPPVAG